MKCILLRINHYYYIIITYYICIITYYYDIITHYCDVITSLIRIITYYYCIIITYYYVIKNPLLRISTRSVIGNNGPIITYYGPTHFGDVLVSAINFLIEDVLERAARLSTWNQTAHVI